MNNIIQVIKMLEEFRKSEAGCAWTKAQTIQSLAPQTIEEAYELAEAAESTNPDEIKSELGDILYHFLFYILIAEEHELFTLDDVCDEVISKHHRRMPSVNQREKFDADEVRKHWDQLKSKERRKQESILDNIPLNFPSTIRSQKLQTRAAEVGFDWENTDQVIEKIHEELEELKHELSQGDNNKIQDELGDLLFSIINLSRHLNMNPETTLRQANRKFETRFRQLEKLTKKRNIDLNQLDMNTSLELWEEVKQSEKIDKT